MVRPAIAEADGKTILFAGGAREEFDVLVWQPAIKPRIPSSIPKCWRGMTNSVDRFQRVVAPREPGLFFVGHAAIVGPVFPVIEQQALWVAELLAGRCPLPVNALAAKAARESKVAAGMFTGISRGEDAVESYPYVLALRRQRANATKVR